MQQQLARSVRLCCSALFGERFQHDDPEMHTQLNITNHFIFSMYFQVQFERKTKDQIQSNRIEMANRKLIKKINEMKRETHVSAYAVEFFL